ncbi:MAG TPA: GAF domain-containing protein, partial [Anaerolineae bacterium]|nr:GAF domain-containing protein [Anaerolineae bacterium]
ERRRNAALQALHGAGATVASSLDRDVILQHIAEESCSLLTSPGRKVSYSSIWLIEKPDAAKLVATFPSDEYTRTVNVIGDTIERKSENGRTGIIWRVINSGQPQLVQNVKDDPDYIQSQADTLSELAVPITFKKEIIGVINVEHSVIDAFDSLDILALEALANQAAVAIETTNLYRKALHHTKLLDAAAAVARYANGILDEELLLDEIVHVIADKLDFHHVAVYLLDKQNKRLTMRSASSEAGKQMVMNEHHLRLGEGIVGKVAQTGQYHLTSDVHLDGNHLANTLLPQTQGEMAFPLIIRGEVIGVLDIQKDKVIDLSNENTAALRTMAKQLSNAMQNARLFEQTQANADTLGALYQAGIAVTSSLDIENILQEIVTQAWSLTGTRGENARFCCLVMKAGEALKFMAAYPPETLDHLRKTVGQISLTTSTKYGIIGRAFKTGQAQRVDDVNKDENYLLYDPETRSELAVPIRAGDKIIGVINVEHPETSVFDSQDEKALVSLASLAAIAIQNAETYREVTLLQEAA